MAIKIWFPKCSFFITTIKIWFPKCKIFLSYWHKIKSNVVWLIYDLINCCLHELQPIVYHSLPFWSACLLNCGWGHPVTTMYCLQGKWQRLWTIFKGCWLLYAWPATTMERCATNPACSWWQLDNPQSMGGLCSRLGSSLVLFRQVRHVPFDK